VDADVAAACGLVPARITRLATPLQRVAVLSTTVLPWLSVLGQTTSVVAVGDGATIETACLRAGLQSGAIAATYDPSTWSTNVTALALANADAVFCDASWGCPGTGVDVALFDYLETSPAAVVEYAGLLSAFFTPTAEAKAVAAISDIASRYACTVKAASDAQRLEALAAASPAAALQPRLLWAYTYGGFWYVSSDCSKSWYCRLVVDAGARLLLTSVPDGDRPALSYGGLSEVQFLPLLAEADIIIYANDNFEADVRPALNSPATALGAALAASPAVRTKRVFDILGRDVNSWFEERPARPDMLLSDLTYGAVLPGAYATLGAISLQPARVWLRAVMAGEPAMLTPPALTPAVLVACAASGASAPDAALTSACARYPVDANGLPTGPAPASTTATSASASPAIVGSAVSGALAAVLLVGVAVHHILVRAPAARPPRDLSSV
jgi:hypothetical protein